MLIRLERRRETITLTSALFQFSSTWYQVLPHFEATEINSHCSILLEKHGSYMQLIH